MEVAQLLDATNEKAITQAADWLRQGHLVVFPTDTVYGVGVDAFDEAAIRKLYEAKKRPFSKGIPVLLADLSDLQRVSLKITAVAHAAIARFWPGPLTLLLPKHPQLPAILSPNENIAVRIPDCAIARSVIRAAGGALATSSANITGQPAARTVAQAVAALGGWITAVVDNGRSPGSLPSTILDCTGNTVQIVRSGPITIKDLALENA